MSSPVRFAARLFALLSLVVLSACGNLPVPGGASGGPRIDPSQPVQVALLVPGGSQIGGDDLIARDLENAARMAVSDLQGAQIDLRVYNTGASPQQASTVTSQAVADGAKIILGPLRADAAVAASAAAAAQNVNVLAFTNTTSVAGGNLFILGPTFENTARRLVGFGRNQGLDRYLVVYGDDAQGTAGRDAISRAVQTFGGTLLGMESYPMTSQQSVMEAAPRIASAAQANGAQAIFLTGGVNADLPIIATALPEAGLSNSDATFMGLTRWDAVPEALSLGGLQGGYFARPDTDALAAFEARYSATYGSDPHPLAGLAYDGVAAVGALVAAGNANALTGGALTQRSGFQGTSGIFRFRSDGTNERALSVAQIRNNQVVIVDPAPSSFAAAGL
ncbi:penicillin-binding protein activator [Pelagovum pacificum]|uniref:Penicillin-binding protein activator n=1 Tax=Pelagovum pacificum TaxID=2588711 RepID=A0A5C5GCU9_9RHOB|nr:penicillin-binding protein activator [Pelagovum pacificum]QQA42335.1 penicillin-binding protein activator [Pelagovum pacificum]TNY31419.1 penicillin-binding protein activator [Pelagovum pacificum]